MLPRGAGRSRDKVRKGRAGPLSQKPAGSRSTGRQAAWACGVGASAQRVAGLQEHESRAGPVTRKQVGEGG